jgi:hypothetical protein
MGEWMDSKNEVRVGDYVMYKEGGSIVTGENGNPLRVATINLSAYIPAVTYDNGEFDWLETIERAPALLLELI